MTRQHTALALAISACGGPAPAGAPPISSDLAQTCFGGPTVEGIDVSDAQGAIDWTSVAGAGIAFAWIKATQGTYYTSASFASSWSDAGAAGVMRGAYHFFDPTDDGVAQAQDFLATVGPLGADDLPPMLDLECPDGDPQCLGFPGGSGDAPGATILARALAWLQTVEAATGKHPIIYSGAFYFPQLGDATALAPYPLWLADPGPNECSTVPAPWTGIAIRQYDWQGSIPGIAGNVDRDRFFGTAAELAELAGPAPTGASNAGGAGEPAVVAAGGDGRLQVFVRDGGTLRYDYQQSATSFTGLTDFADAVAGRPATAIDADGGLALVVRWADSTIALTRQQGGPADAWAAWSSLGGIARSDPALAVNDDGRLEVFALGDDLAMWHAFETSPGGAWSGWASLGGAQLSAVHAASDASGAIVALARGADGQLYERHQLADRSQWSDWISVGGTLASDFAVATAGNSLDVFVRGADGALWLATRDPIGGWSGWQSLHGSLASNPSIAADPAGALHAFAVGTDGAVWTAAQAEGWTWETLGGDGASDPAGRPGVAGALTAFVRGTDAAWYVDFDDGDHWSGWTGL